MTTLPLLHARLAALYADVMINVLFIIWSMNTLSVDVPLNKETVLGNTLLFLLHSDTHTNTIPAQVCPYLLGELLPANANLELI